MSIMGYPTDPGDQGPHDGSNRPVPSEPPPDDWNAKFTAIVSGISGGMRWEVSDPELDDEAGSDADGADADPGNGGHPAHPPVYPRAREIPWTSETDTPETRRLRREIRRQERADALAAHLQAKAEFEAEMAADEEHYVPPVPPPIPRPKRRTVAALLLLAVGILLLAWPTLLPVSGDLNVVLSLILILGGLTILVLGMRRQHGAPGEGWDDGAEV
jgi:hypothetical protein